MVKMGLFGILRWLAPVLATGTWVWGDTASALCIIGMIYASLIAIKQDDLKRLVAYSSIAHIGLMCAALFSTKQLAIEGVMIQMFNHGINIIGLWIVIELIERQLGIRKISQLGGIANKAPILTISLVVIALANIALPLTNSFIGEFLMFAGLYQFNVWYTAIAGISIILAAIYTLNMVQKVFYGEVNTLTVATKEIAFSEKVMLALIIVAIFLVGLFPQPLLQLTNDSVAFLMTKFK